MYKTGVCVCACVSVRVYKTEYYSDIKNNEIMSMYGRNQRNTVDQLSSN